MLEWACERAGYSIESFAQSHPKLSVERWHAAETLPTLKQLEAFAAATRTPVGQLFLSKPPVESIPIQDLRTVKSRGVARPSPDLLDTIYICQQRQEWYRDYARSAQLPEAEFVGSADRGQSPVAVAADIRARLGMSTAQRTGSPRLDDALRGFIEQAESAGVLVMVSGVVGSNNNRKLDPEEFRGFALSDRLAPLVFVNGGDSKSAQMFTLAHELAHLWIGETALSDATVRSAPDGGVERWCNQVAAELLVPADEIATHYRSDSELGEELKHLSRMFKVSSLVVLRRLRDIGRLSHADYRVAYDAELQRIQAHSSKTASGGNFYYTTAARVGKRFARAVITTTLEGRASFTEALRLLGFKKMDTFKKLGVAVGVEA